MRLTLVSSQQGYEALILEFPHIPPHTGPTVCAYFMHCLKSHFFTLRTLTANACRNGRCAGTHLTAHSARTARTARTGGTPCCRMYTCTDPCRVTRHHVIHCPAVIGGLITVTPNMSQKYKVGDSRGNSHFPKQTSLRRK